MNGPNAAVQGRPYLLDLVDPRDASERRWQTDKEGRNGNKQAYGAYSPLDEFDVWLQLITTLLQFTLHE